MTNADFLLSINFILPLKKIGLVITTALEKGYQSLEVKPNFNLSGFTPTMGLFCLESDSP